MALHPACHSVEDYLAAWFPGGIIEEFEWTPQCWVFKVRVPTLTFRLLVSTEFLDKTDDHEIEQLLHRWQVAHRMRAADSSKWVHVTAEGVILGTHGPRRI